MPALNPFQLQTDLQQINALSACRIKTDRNQEIRQKRIAAVERHIEALRKYAARKQGRVQKATSAQAETVETLLALACQGQLQ